MTSTPSPLTPAGDTRPVPYYSDETVQLFYGDYRELLPILLADHSFDLVVADPPYGETSLDWDRWPDGWPAAMPGRSMWCFGSMRMFLERRGGGGGEERGSVPPAPGATPPPQTRDAHTRPRRASSRVLRCLLLSGAGARVRLRGAGVRRPRQARRPPPPAVQGTCA